MGRKVNHTVLFLHHPLRTLLRDGDVSARRGKNKLKPETKGRLTNGGWRSFVLFVLSFGGLSGRLISAGGDKTLVLNSVRGPDVNR